LTSGQRAAALKRVTQWVLIGAGYSGTRLAQRLVAAGARVIATRQTSAGVARTASNLGPAATVCLASLHERGSLDGLIPRGAVVVDMAPPTEGDTAAEENLVAAAARAGARRLIYVSSTGVYGPGDGAWIDEDAPLAPIGALGRRRLAAESALLHAAAAAGLPAVALRAAAIYGPHRGVHARIAAGSYRVIGDGAGHVSRIHVDDLAAAVIAVAQAPSPQRTAYNVADDEPTRSREHADAIAALLGLPPPPSIRLEEASAEARDLSTGDRRIANRRLRDELGAVLAYPTWREGLAQALAEERARPAR
jgi:nucleoside-diphosphate-sugar epimerase